MEQQIRVLEGSSEQEKLAYLGVIASIATADRQASPEEQEYLEALCASANLSETSRQQVLKAAQQAEDLTLTQHLNVLKNSDLKYSLVTDLITFAQSDNEYSEEEKKQVQQIAGYLQVDQQQYALLEQYADQALHSDAAPEEVTQPNFLANNGLQQKMQGAGINTNGLLKGLLSFVGPMILASMMRRRGGIGGGFGGALGGMLGGAVLGGRSRRGMGGGIGSLIGMLSGGRGMRGAGGMLGRMLGGRF